MRRSLGSILASLVICSFVSILHGEVVVSTALDLSSFQISAGGLPVMISGVTASAFASVFDNLGGACTATGAVLTGPCFGYDSETTASASVSASQGFASAAAGADPSGLTANASSFVNIPDGIPDSAGTNAVGPYGDLSGTFEVMDSTTHPVTVNFSAALSGGQSLFTDSAGVSAYSETIFNLLVPATSSANPACAAGSLDELCWDQPYTIGPSQTVTNTINTALTYSDNSLMTNTPYYFDAQVDAESLGVNTPEPSFFVVIALGLIAIPLVRSISRRGRGHAAQRLCAAAALILSFAGLGQAKYIGGDPPKSKCPPCGCGCTRPANQQRSNTSSTVSDSEGNAAETVPISTVRSANRNTLDFALTYNSYNADGSRATIDTVVGYGWTHSFNIFLFGQLGSMFRYDGDGRVTRYSLGAGGAFITAAGYFETLTQSGTTFTITDKDQTKYTFMPVAGTPFLVGGPVYRITQIVDRDGNTTRFTYTSGNLTGVTDPYGRTITFSYNAQNHLSSVKDPAGRVTSFQYDTTGHMLTKITDPLGKTIQYSYNSQFQITNKVDKAGRTFQYAYNSSFLPAAVYDASHTGPFTLSNPNNWATDPTQLAQNQLRVYLPSTTTNTDGRGNQWKYQYDANGYLLQETDPDGSITKYTYDPATLQLASMTDANGHTTNYVYNSEGDLTQKTDALGHVTKYTYDPAFNIMTSMTDPLGRVTTYTIDPANGNETSETDPLGFSSHWTYNPDGTVATFTDKNGNVTHYLYDSSGNLVEQIDAYGTSIQSTTQFTYDAVGNRISMTDALGRVTQYQYDSMNRVIQETDAVGTAQQRTIQNFYDGEGNRTEAIDGRGIETLYQYDLRQRLITETDAVGTPQERTTATTYDSNDNRITVTDPLGRVTQYQYDSRNRVIQETDALGTPVSATTKTAYDAVSNVVSETDANGHTTTYTYDALNRRSSATDALGEETLYFYDGGTFTGSVTLGGAAVTCNQCGATPGSSLITKQVDPDGTASLHAGTTYSYYDALDRVVIIDRKTGCIGGNSGAGCPNTIDTATDAVTLYTYDLVDNRLTSTEPDGNTTQYFYDQKNRLDKEINAAGDTTLTTYDLVNNIVTVTAPNLNVATNAYDALNRVVTVTDSIGLEETDSYDADNNRTSHGDGDGNITTYAYDALNRMVTATDPLSKTTTTAYDLVNNLLTVTDRNGNTATDTYDALNRKITMTDALGNVTGWTYDEVGNLIELTDANSHSTQYSYDAVNRPLCETYADGTMRCYVYDPAGDLIKREDAISGQTVTYTYSDLYFLLERAYTPSGAQDTFTYDLSGRMLRNQRANGPFTWPESFQYDGANRLIQSVQDGRTINYTYNLPARMRTLQYPGGREVTEYTDARMRMDHIDNNTSTTPPIAQYTYDLANNMLTRNYANGTASSYSYNANNWMLSIAHNSPAASPSTFAGFHYAYDNEGNKQYEQKTHDPKHSECYGYDVTYRVTSYQSGTLGSPAPCPAVPPPTPPTQTSYVLDPVGNWNSKTTNGTTQTRMHNSVNEITEINAIPLTYDADGDLTNDGTYKYQYDEEHRLTCVTKAATCVTFYGQYQYDALSRRVQKIADASGTPATTLYFYDDGRIVEEESPAFTTQATYVYGNYIDEILTMDRSGSTYYYHQNQLWSVEAITNSSGNPVERYDYCGGDTLQCGDPYGAVTIYDGSFNPIAPNAWGTAHSAIGNPWMFTGREFDEETGLYYYRARSYDPLQGRFLQRDPDDLVNGPNPYQYGFDNPLGFVDPTGSQAKPYDQMSREELMKLYDPLAARWAGLDLVANLDPQGEFARKYNITPAQIRDAQEKIKQMKAIQQELDRRNRASQSCSRGNPCQVFWTIMNLAGEYDVISEGISNIEAIYNIATIGGFKLVTQGGKALTKKEIAAQLAKWAAPKIAEALGVPTDKIGYAKKLLSDILDPQKACFALAECEATVNKRGGIWERRNAVGRAIRSCAWDTKGVNWYKSGWLVNLQNWLGF